MRALICFSLCGVTLFAFGQDASERSWDDLVKRFRSGETAAYRELVSKGRAAIPHLAQVLKDKRAGVTQFLAANALGEIAHPECVEPLLAALKDPWFNVRRCAALAVGKTRDERAREPLQKLAASDPYTWTDPKSGEVSYLVRDDARRALKLLEGGHPDSEPEVFMKDASRPPRRSAPSMKKVPWPFPGGLEKQNLYNNYQQPTGIYVHAALDLLQEAGTVVRAVEGGTVACISTNYPDWDTHHFFVVRGKGGGNEGWCYTHVDPASFTFELGSEVKKEQVLGKVVNFSVGPRDGIDHLHLSYVRFEVKADGKVETESLYDPLIRFRWKDRTPPTLHQPVLVHAGSLNPIPTEKPVSGAVDIIVGVSDHAYEGHVANWMVPVVTLEILGKHARPWRKLVLDQRGPVSTRGEVSALYVPPRESKRFGAGLPRNPVVYFLKVTNTDGDGVIEASDEHQIWDTAALDDAGKRRFPDGEYEIIVRAWDLAGNLGVGRAHVQIANPPRPEKDDKHGD